MSINNHSKQVLSCSDMLPLKVQKESMYQQNRHAEYTMLTKKQIKSYSNIMEHPTKRRELLYCKVHIFLEGHLFLQNLHRRFVLCSNGQMYGGDFAKFRGLLRIYDL